MTKAQQKITSAQKQRNHRNNKTSQRRSSSHRLNTRDIAAAISDGIVELAIRLKRLLTPKEITFEPHRVVAVEPESPAPY